MKISAREIIRTWEDSKNLVSPIYQFEDFSERLQEWFGIKIDEELEKKK